MDGDTSHINNTIIDGSQPSNPDSGSVVYFVSGEDTTSMLTGFTITGGTGTSILMFNGRPGTVGGGIHIRWSGAKIENNKIIHNQLIATAPGVIELVAGIAIYAVGDTGDYLVIRDNLISENTTTYWLAFSTIVWGMKETVVFERNVVSANVINADHAIGGGLNPLGYAGWQGAYIIVNIRLTHSFHSCL
jgi:hypothetical protein